MAKDKKKPSKKSRSKKDSSKKAKKGSTKKTPKPAKKLGLSARRQRAFELFSRGFSVTDVARELQVSRTTATDYKKRYEAQIAKEVAENPGFLRDAVANTARTLAELDEVRKLAWKRLEATPQVHDVKCDECGEITTFVYRDAPSDQIIVQFQNVLLKAGEQRAKLFGLLGVKQEVLIEIQSVSFVNQAVLGWLVENLPSELREALAEWMATELADYIKTDGDQAVPVLQGSVLGELAAASLPAQLEDDEDIVDAELVA